MKLKKSSWHYKINIWDWPSRNLCTYFWQVVFSVFSLFVVLPICGAVVLIMALIPLINLFTQDENALAAAVGAIEIILLICFWIGYRTAHYPKNPRQKKEPSLIGQYIKVKKDKICPLLEFE